MTDRDIAGRLESSLRESLLADLASAGFLTDRITAHSTSQLLVTYFSAARRRVPARPRTVHVSALVEASIAAVGEEARCALDQIRRDIESGRPLWPYMSTRIGNSTPQRGNGHPPLRVVPKLI